MKTTFGSSGAPRPPGASTAAPFAGAEASRAHESAASPPAVAPSSESASVAAATSARARERRRPRIRRILLMPADYSPRVRGPVAADSPLSWPRAGGARWAAPHVGRAAPGLHPNPHCANGLSVCGRSGPVPGTVPALGQGAHPSADLIGALCLVPPGCGREQLAALHDAHAGVRMARESHGSHPAPPPRSTTGGLGPLRRLRRGLLRMHLAAMRRPGWTLFLAGLVTLGLASQAPRLRVVLSLGSLGEKSLLSTASNERLRESFPTRNELILLFAPEVPGQALTPEQVGRVRAWLEREERENPEVERVVSPFHLQHRRDIGTFSARRPYLETGSREEMRELAASLWGGILTDREGRDLAALINLRDTPGGSRYGRFDPRVVAGIEHRARRDFAPGSGVRVHLIGPAAFEHYSLRGIQWFRYLNIAMLLVVLVLLRVLLGTWRSGVMLAGILLVAALCVAGGMALARAPIDLLSTGMFLILAVAALEDFLFLSYLQLHDGLDWRACFRRMLVPSLLTSLTTVIGFWSLCTS